MTQDKYLLAEAGLYYTKEGDVVKCFACDVKLSQWLSTDIPLCEHRKWSPGCIFLSMIGYRERTKQQPFQADWSEAFH